MKQIKIPEFKVTCVRVEADSGNITGKTIDQSNIRRKYGVNILAILRNDKMIYPIFPDEKIQQNDMIYVSGDPEGIDKFYKAVR